MLSCSYLNIRYFIELNISNMSLLNASVNTATCLQGQCSLNFSLDSRQSMNVPYEVIITIIELRKKLSLQVGKCNDMISPKQYQILSVL